MSMIFRTLETHRDFETIARDFLAKNPDIRHEWRQVRSVWNGGLTELRCAPGEDNEVLAVLRSYQITIATLSGDKDFEDWGRGLSDEAIAREAFAYFVDALERQGLIPVNFARQD